MTSSTRRDRVKRILEVANGAMREHQSIRDEQLDQLWSEVQDLRCAGDDETYYFAKLALATVSRTASDIKGILDEGLAKVGPSVQLIGNGSASLARFFQSCEAAKLLLSYAGKVDYPPLLLRHSLGIYLLSGHLTALDEAAKRLAEMGEDRESDLAHQRNAVEYRDWLRKHGVSERGLQALCRLRDQAVAEADVNPAALRAPELDYQITFDESDATAAMAVCFPRATNADLHAIASRQEELREDSCLAPNTLRSVTFVFKNRRASEATTMDGFRPSTHAERSAHVR